MSDSIYIVELHDYDTDDVYGFFLDYKKAKLCCDFLNIYRPSPYDIKWYITELKSDNTDYESLIKEYKEKEKLEFERRQEKIKQQELEELARLKAKYESN